jgi:hypothetical protein
MPRGVPEIAQLHLPASGLARIRHWLRHVLGLDRAVGFSVLARFWSSAAGLVTVALIARFLSPAEQATTTRLAAWWPCRSCLSWASRW